MRIVSSMIVAFCWFILIAIAVATGLDHAGFMSAAQNRQLVASTPGLAAMAIMPLAMHYGWWLGGIMCRAAHVLHMDMVVKYLSGERLERYL